MKKYNFLVPNPPVPPIFFFIIHACHLDLVVLDRTSLITNPCMINTFRPTPKVESAAWRPSRVRGSLFTSLQCLNACVGLFQDALSPGGAEGPGLPDVFKIHRVIFGHDAREAAAGARLLVRSAATRHLPHAELLQRHAPPQVHRDRLDASLRASFRQRPGRWWLEGAFLFPMNSFLFSCLFFL